MFPEWKTDYGKALPGEALQIVTNYKWIPNQTGSSILFFTNYRLAGKLIIWQPLVQGIMNYTITPKLYKR